MMKSNDATRELDIAIATQVFEREIEGLVASKEALGDDFYKVVETLLATTGRVIAMGIGKSGLIAKKFAATLASMGTPSMFIHPIEALHGDLGMVTSQDVVFILSNSGESSEIMHVVEHCKRFRICTIGMCRNASSSLAAVCDATLVLPNIPEAAAIPAPTTSTTMMLAMSDAIAVVLAERKGFTHADFKTFHPGGSLGAQLSKLIAFMHTGEEMPIVHPNTSMAETILEMTKKRLGCTGVVDDNGCLVGLITDGDLRRHIEANYHTTRAEELMTRNPTTFTPDLFAAEALYIMNERKITHSFIVDDCKPIGIVHIHDLLKARVA